MANSNATKNYLISFYVKVNNAQNAENEIKILQKQIEQLGIQGIKASDATNKLGIDVGKLAARAMVTIPVWLALRASVMAVLNTFQNGVKFLIDWEYQLAQVKIVGGTTKEELDTLSITTLDLAKNLGLSADKMGEGIKLWAQQGLAVREIIPLMEATAKLSMLTGRNIADSVSDITASMKAYGIESSNVMRIVDSVTNVMLNHAIEADKLVAALKNVSPVAAQFGIAFEKLQGIITAAYVVTRSEGSKVGTAFRTIFDRMATSARNAIQDIAKVPVYLDKMGEPTRSSTQVLRNLGDVLDETAMKFQNLGNKEQIRLAEAMAGKRQLNELLAYFGNYEEAIKAQASALTGAGKATEATSILTDTFKHRLESTTQAFHQFVMATTDLELMKSGLTGVKTVLESLTSFFDPAAAGYLQFVKIIQEGNKNLLESADRNEAILGTMKEFAKYQDIFKRNPTVEKMWQPKVLDIYKNALENKGIKLSPKEGESIEGYLNRVEPLRSQMEYVVKLKNNTLEYQNKLVEIRSTVKDIEKFLIKSPDLFEYVTQGVTAFIPNLNNSASEILKTIRQGKISISSQLGEQYARSQGYTGQNRIDFLKSIENYNKRINELETVSTNKSSILNDQKRDQIKQELEALTLSDEQLKTMNKLLNHHIDILQTQGASKSQLIETQWFIEKEIMGYIDEAKQLDYILKLEKARNEEKAKFGKAQKYSTETEILYDIAQEHGQKVATDISNFIHGQMSTRKFGYTDVLEQYFPGLYAKREKQDEMEKYFGKRGQNIPIDEIISNQETTSILNNLYGEKWRMESENYKNYLNKQKETIAEKDITRNYEIAVSVPVNVNIEVVTKKVDEFRQAMAKEIEDKNSKLGKAVRNVIEEY